MKAITNKDKLPKFLIVNDIPEKRSCNKHLLKPYRKGEIVKVAPFEEQQRNTKYDDQFQFEKPNNDPNWFRERYVVIYRKDENGKFTLKYTEGWESFDLLTKIKTK